MGGFSGREIQKALKQKPRWPICTSGILGHRSRESLWEKGNKKRQKSGGAEGDELKNPNNALWKIAWELVVSSNKTR